MKQLVCIKNKIASYKDRYILIVSVLFGIIISMGKIANDDIAIVGKIGNSLQDLIKWAVDQYNYWSSRQLINFAWALVLRCGRFAWFIYMSVSMFVMLKALKLLFGDNKRVELYIIALVMSFPFGTLMNAGWIATTISYFGPQAFALMALVPIKKVIKNEKFGFGELIVYSICLVYGANAEQTCIVLLGSYFIATIFLIYEKKYNWKIAWLTILTILSLIYTITCPGNWSRDDVETMAWFPTFGMLDIIDKSDIGVSTTLRWMLASGKLFVIITCIMMTYFVWKRYKQPMYRFISMIPTAGVVLLGPMENVLESLFPYLGYASNEVDYYGEFTADVSKIGSGMLQFAIFLGIIACICVEIFLLNDNVQGLIVDFTLAVMAVASRSMIGFVPSVYASNERTYTPLVFCMIALSVHIYSKNILIIEKKSKKENIGKYTMYGLIICGFLNLMYLVVTAFY